MTIVALLAQPVRSAQAVCDAAFSTVFSDMAMVYVDRTYRRVLVLMLLCGVNVVRRD